jgi:hypothetical protein
MLMVSERVGEGQAGRPSGVEGYPPRVRKGVCMVLRYFVYGARKVSEWS